MIKTNIFALTFLFFPLSLSCMDLENDKEILSNITGPDLFISDDESEQKTNSDHFSTMPQLVIEKICSHLDLGNLLSLRVTGKKLAKKVLNSSYSINNLEEEIVQQETDPLPFPRGTTNIKSISAIITDVVYYIDQNTDKIAKKWYDQSLHVTSKSTAKSLYTKLCLLNRALTYKKEIAPELKQEIKAEFKNVLKAVWLCRNNLSITEHKKIIQAIARKHRIPLDTGWVNRLKSLYHRVIHNQVVMTTLSMAAIAGILYTYLTTQSLLNSPKYVITHDYSPYWKYIGNKMAMIRPLTVQTKHTCYDTNENGNTINAQYKPFYTYSPLFSAITMAGYLVFKFIRPVRMAGKKILRCWRKCYCCTDDYVCGWDCSCWFCRF